MTIQEQLDAINATFQRLHQDFTRFDAEKRSLSARFSLEHDKVQKKWEGEQARITAVREDVLKYYRIAKENSLKELSTAGAAASPPNIGLLNQLVEQIDYCRRDDAVAGRIIGLCGQYTAYLDRELSQLRAREQAEQADVDSRQRQAAAQLTRQKKQVLAQCEQYLRGEDVANLTRLFEMIHQDYEITPESFRGWGQAVRRKRMMLMGFQQFPLDVPQIFCGTLKDSLGHHFDENTRLVNCPRGFPVDSPQEICVEYTEKNEAQAKKGLQALLLNLLRYSQPGDYKVSVFDRIHYNADLLGPLSALITGKNAVIDKPASDEKAMHQNLSILAEQYRKVEARLGTQTLFEYNSRRKPSDGRIPFRVLILNQEDNVYRGQDEPELAYVANNAGKFGLILVRMLKSPDGGSKGKDREKKYPAGSAGRTQMISDGAGRFYIRASDGGGWLPFQWLDAPSALPRDFIEKVTAALQPKELGCKYFDRYSVKTPKKSVKTRRPIQVPFAIDEDDHVISCTFENDLFAAYIMGAAGSGKSTLLHTIISGLIMDYHPDELELWLMDFKMLEFKRYVDHRPPHVKYILLEKSEDLVFDIIDHLTELLDRRQFLFSQKGWSKLTDVPPEENMPAVFVIIDEFAQMSQILRETRGMGYGADYTIKLENLLAKGRALGLKFIFASQTYTTGISGLTETACKQIQLRFALKNTPDEIRQTLSLSSDQITPELGRAIDSMPAYETLFKWADGDNNVHIGRYRNLYTEGDQVERLVDAINAAIHPVPAGSKTDDSTCIDKKPVLIDGSRPKTFKSQIPCYREYERTQDPDERDESDILIYAGVPCSFSPARPFPLCSATAENILVAGGDRDSKVNIVLSVLNSYGRTGHEIEIWAHERSPIFKRYRGTVFARHTQRTDLAELCGEIASLKKMVQRRSVPEKLIVCFGYENLASDFDILGDGAGEPAEPVPQRDNTLPDMSEILRRVQACPDPAEKRRIIEEYNRQREALEASGAQEAEESPSGGIYDAREDVEWILKRAPNYGLHFLFCFDQARDFLNLRMDENAFRHKILFPMSKDESLAIMGSRKANEVGDGTCVYSSGKDAFTLRPHIYRGVSCSGWTIDDNGTIVQGG